MAGVTRPSGAATLYRVTGAPTRGGVNCRLVGGLAVYLHVQERDPEAARLTVDIDVAVRREELDQVRRAVEPFGFRHRHCGGGRPFGGCGDWGYDQPVLPAPSSSGVSQPDRSQSSTWSRRALGDGQLRHPQSGKGEALVCSSSALACPLHADQRQLAELVERLFAELTERCIRRGSHTTVLALEKAMLDYLDRRNRKPTPSIWTATADLILGKIARLCKRISKLALTRLV